MALDIKFLESQLVGGRKKIHSLSHFTAHIKDTVVSSGVRSFLEKKDAACILALAMKESGFGQAMLNSRTGASGWLQIMPNTYKGLAQYVVGNNKYADAVKARCRHHGFTTVLALHTPTMRQAICEDFAASVALTRLNHRYLAVFLQRQVDKGLVLDQTMVDHLYAVGHHVPAYMVKLVKSLPKHRTVNTADIHDYLRIHPTWKGNPMLADYEKFIRFYPYAQEISDSLWG